MELFSLTKNVTITDVQWHAYPVGFFLLVLCLLTIFGNLLIIYAIIREHTLHTSTYYYVGSLAFADLLVGLIAMPFAFIFEMTDDEYWLFPRHLRFLCDFWHSMDIFATTASILGLCTIGLDRYLYITKPIEYPASFISKKWYFMLSFIWIVSAFISFPAVFHFGTAQEIARRSLSSNETITPAWLLFKECEFPDNPYYILFISIVSCYLPLIIMIYVYIQLYLAAKKQVQALRSGYKHHYLRKSAKSFIPVFRLREPPTRRGASIQRTARIPESSARKLSFTLLPNRRPSFELITLRIHHGKYRNPTADHCRRSSRIENRSIQKATKKSERTNSLWRKISKNQKAAKFIGIIMGVFVVCWLPYFVYLIFSGVFGIRLKDDLNHELLFKIFSWLGYTNSLLDVLVYVSTSKELRVTLCKLVLGHRYRSKYNYP
ncbi:unnamed protein product [Rotaria magnacalcarata]|uniref:G-protein coupled receptors family 1 profile domain-containing protein n=2 Tax=Rotaria magnacalcarata TaxID=392030 RepID=A0A815JSD2_9BILA|nr:unnamed protein product [Rotaria magnacalcarata]CAF1483379.1 unnamed protein product [Rotaria magnacalcarata]CAF2064534.1 unnamed protein product [Rotaria magnacalcarata]CAF2149132.1 unnamed protein product [Rotaria magnacalcarata]CAF2250721.1 unnamed protein product [Rotaria magnacalcarata]